MNSSIENGTIHQVPDSLKSILIANPKILETWNQLTPLARNEWICYVTMPKKEETKLKRLTRTTEDLLKGKKRPCCWPGCPHHRESAQKWFK